MLFPNIAVPFPNFTGTIGQAGKKPFPQYNGISDPWLDVANSTYNSLQVSLTHRMSHGLTFMVNYTYSKELDDIAGVPRSDDKDFPWKKGLGTIDHTHVATATFVYQLPFGAGRRLNSANKVLSALISQWQLSGIFTFTSGAPLSITGTCTGGGIIDASCYPNYSPGFSGSVWQNGTPGTGNLATTPYLSKAAFVDAPKPTPRATLRVPLHSCYSPRTTRMWTSAFAESSASASGRSWLSRRTPSTSTMPFTSPRRVQASMRPLSASFLRWPIRRANCSSAPG